jgi:4-amino-4-deoxy-L-arabinose transferase-like glycosyltransferase
VESRKRSSEDGAARARHSSRLRAFLTSFNRGPDDDERRFSPKADPWLFLGLGAVIAVALVVRLPFFGDGIAASDTTVYLRVAQDITQGLFPSDLRPPGYSLLLAAFDGLGLDPVNGIVGLQNLIGIFLPAAAVLAGWRFFRLSVGLGAGFLTAASPLMIVTEQLALADYLFGVALFIAAALLAETALRLRAGRSPWRLLVATGFVFGLATMFRANGQLGFVAIPVALLLATRDWRSMLRPAVAAIGGMLILILPVVTQNLVLYGDFSVATEGGISLYSRVITGDRVPPPTDSAEGRLAFRIYNTAEPGPLVGVESGRPTTALFDALIAEGKSESEASSVMGGLAKQAIFEYPDIYLENTWNILGEYRSLYDPGTFGANPTTDQIAITRNYLRSIEPTRTAVPGDSALTSAFWHIAQSVTKFAYLVTIGGLLVLLLPFLGIPRKRLAASTFIVVGLLGMVGGSLTGVFSYRYDLMFAPIVWLLLAATIVCIVELIAAAVRRRPDAMGS